MKRFNSVFIYSLLSMTAFLPFTTLLFTFFGCFFEFKIIDAFLMLTAILSIITAISSFALKEPSRDKRACKACVLLTPISIINAAFCIWKCEGILATACMVICVGCSVLITIKQGGSLVLKGFSLGLSVLMIIPVIYYGFILMIFRGMAQNTVVNTIESTNGTYYAEVIDSDQGALGGDTIVDVYKSWGTDNAVFKLCKKVDRVYVGDWGEAYYMEIYWKTDDCLVINSIEYMID